MSDSGIRFIRLESPKWGELELLPDTNEMGPYNVTKFDIGYPAPREVSRYSPFVDGDRDSTQLHGPRVISIELDVFGDQFNGPNFWTNKIKQWTHPQDRSWLIYREQGASQPYRTLVRCESFASDWVATRNTYHEVKTLWKAPSGRIETVGENMITIRPDAEPIGREYPLEYPREYPNAGPLSGAIVNNIGSARANLVIRIFGPVEKPSINNDTLGLSYVFKDGYEITAGNYVEIQSERRRVLLNGLENQSVLNEIDFEATNWWSLETGENQVRFNADSFGTNAQAQIRWRSTYL